jgi:hypothetical protein
LRANVIVQSISTPIITSEIAAIATIADIIASFNVPVINGMVAATAVTLVAVAVAVSGASA